MTRHYSHICACALFLALSPWSAAALAQELPPADRNPILLDCAVGGDIGDAFALAIATADPTLELRGVTTVSGDAEVRAWMVCRFLTAIGRQEVPVAFGRGKQPAAEIGAQFQYRYHPAVLFNRTAKPVKQSAAELLHERLRDGKPKVTIVCTGPLTNLSELLNHHPAAREHIEQIIVTESGANLTSDQPAAKAVFGSGIPLLLVTEEAVRELRFDDRRLEKTFSACTPRTLQLQTLYELWQGRDPVLADAAAVALASPDKRLKEAFTLVERAATISADGSLALAEGSSHVRVVESLKGETLLDWLESRLSEGEPALPREPANRTRPIDRGRMPHRVHVAEDYETDIERRWWLAGIPETKNLPPGSSRACRGMLTMDFDDLQGDTRTMYRAVVFNPVPGPPMGKHPRLSFRCWLKGSDKLRVQIYTLSNGYHRYLSLAELPQERWLDLAVDMTQARRPDGSGGPLSENERIDDIQFYADPRAELIIDDVVLFDAAADDEQRPFPNRLHFTGWFDTGKQGQEWPGAFEIAADRGYFWKAASAVAAPDGKGKWIRLNLRGRRPVGRDVRVDFRYRAAAAVPLELVLLDSAGGGAKRVASLAVLKPGDWQEASVAFSAKPGANSEAQDSFRPDELHFVLPMDGEFLLDDVLLYEPGQR